MEAPQPPSDAELIARVRNGELEAYGELFSRHHHAAERMARQLVPAADADDLAGDAFAKVLEALRAGGGPDVSFRGYLLTTVRRVHVNRIRAARRVQATDDPAAYEREPESFDDRTVTGFESGAAAKAFASLPERWQAVLWHTEVEGEKPAAVAPLLGLTPNGVSALAYRAREGLRQAYLQQHLADVAGDRCRWLTERLGAYVRDGLTGRENKTASAPRRVCKCAAVYLELVEVNSALPSLLAPALLGTAATGYLAAGGARAGFVGVLWGKVTASPRNAVTTGAGVVAVVVAGLLVALQSPAARAARRRRRSSSRPGQPTQQPTQPPVKPPTKPPVKPPTQPPAAGADDRAHHRTHDRSDHGPDDAAAVHPDAEPHAELRRRHRRRRSRVQSEGLLRITSAEEPAAGGHPRGPNQPAGAPAAPPPSQVSRSQAPAAPRPAIEYGYPQRQPAAVQAVPYTHRRVITIQASERQHRPGRDQHQVRRGAGLAGRSRRERVDLPPRQRRPGPGPAPRPAPPPPPHWPRRSRHPSVAAPKPGATPSAPRPATCTTTTPRRSPARASTRTC